MKKKAQLSRPTSDFWNDVVLQNIDYARYLTGHKYNLGSAGIKMGLSPGKIIAHDWSKFKPARFDIYEDYFYGPEGIRGKLSPKVYKAFKSSVKEHYKTEAHHAHKLGLPQTKQTQIEAVADWYSVGKTQADMKGINYLSFVDWWNQHKNRFLLKGNISKSTYTQIEETLKKNYNILSYTIDKIKELFK